jgi:hypothetical protein
MTDDTDVAIDGEALTEREPLVEPFVPASANADDHGERLAGAVVQAGLALSGVLRQEIAVAVDATGPARTAPVGHPFAARNDDGLVGVVFITEADLVGLADLQMGGSGTSSDRTPSALEQDLALGLVTGALAPLVRALIDADARAALTLMPMEDTVAVPRRSLRLDLAISGPTCRFTPTLVLTPREERDAAGSADATDVAAAFAGVPVEVKISFEPIATPATDLMELAVGDVLCLDHRTTTPLLAQVGPHHLLRVSPGRRGPHAAVVVTELLAPSLASVGDGGAQ